MQAQAIVGGKLVSFRLSPELARAHRVNAGKTMTIPRTTNQPRGGVLAVAFDRLESATDHQQRQFRELEQRPHHAFGRRDDQDGHRQSARRQPVLLLVQAMTW
jgi:hypothetical protein